MVEERAHGIADFGFGPVGPGNRPQPLLDGDRTNLTDHCFPPPWEDPAIENGLTTIPGRVRPTLFSFVYLFVLREDSAC